MTIKKCYPNKSFIESYIPIKFRQHHTGLTIPVSDNALTLFFHRQHLKIHANDPALSHLLKTDC